jgi:hypothetical protein
MFICTHIYICIYMDIEIDLMFIVIHRHVVKICCIDSVVMLIIC